MNAAAAAIVSVPAFLAGLVTGVWLSSWKKSPSEKWREFRKPAERAPTPPTKAATRRWMMPFERFDRQLRPRRGHVLTITRHGGIGFGAVSWEAIGSPQFVTLVMDPVQRVFGVQAATNEDGKAFAVIRSGTSGSNFLVGAASFCRHYEIEHSVARRWRAEVVGSVLCARLDDPFAVVSSNRLGR